MSAVLPEVPKRQYESKSFAIGRICVNAPALWMAAALCSFGIKRARI